MADIKEKQPAPKLNNTTKKRKSKLRENIESIAFAIAIAFAIRYFVVEAFKNTYRLDGANLTGRT